MNEFKWSKIKKPVFVLAPMANITTLPFRSICKEFGADIVFTPMLSSNAIVYNPNETYKIAEFREVEQPVIVQIFGYSPEIMAKAAVMVDKALKPAGIDINMGCPAPKITGNECGSALLRDFEKAKDIVRAVRAEYKGQLSVKLRLGWRDNDVLELVRDLEKLGVDAVSIHGRTTKQGYSGKADWEEILKIAAAVEIPVIGNGDIDTWGNAIDLANEPDLTGIMIGRGTLERPWIFQEIKEKKTIEYTQKELGKLILRQSDLMIKYLGDETRAITEMRKFYGWYLKGFPGALALRKEAMIATSLNDIEKLVSKI